ncbi:MAG: hypothetical protein U0U70_12240 [Chitinophagaceae bacterium]
MKNFKTILALLIGAVIGFSFCHLFHRSCPDVYHTVTTADSKASQLEKKVQETEVKYQQKIDSVQQRTQALDESLKKTQTALDKTKRKNIELQTQVYDLIDRQGVYKEEHDTASYIEGCDSLQSRVDELIIQTNLQDSIQTAVTDNLHEQILRKDSVILLKDSQYQQLNKSFEQSIEQQKLLEQEAKFYKKKYKRQRLGSKLKNLGLLIISGFAASQLIH